ncbi:hypothetical protein FOXYSP1_20529 [Fusarium oxysporum f. sp. phaseoli]
MKVAKAESGKDGGGLTIGGITGAVILTVVIICIPACPNSGGPILGLKGRRLSHQSMSKIWILCKAPRRMTSRGALLSHPHIPFTLSLLKKRVEHYLFLCAN